MYINLLCFLLLARNDGKWRKKKMEESERRKKDVKLRAEQENLKFECQNFMIIDFVIFVNSAILQYINFSYPSYEFLAGVSQSQLASQHKSQVKVKSQVDRFSSISTFLHPTWIFITWNWNCWLPSLTLNIICRFFTILSLYVLYFFRKKFISQMLWQRTEKKNREILLRWIAQAERLFCRSIVIYLAVEKHCKKAV